MDRMVYEYVDYKHLNNYTDGDSYPTTDITDIIHRVGKSHYINTYDAKSGYCTTSFE